MHASLRGAGGSRLDMGMVEEEYAKIMAVPEQGRSAAVIALVSARPEVFVALRQCCFCGFCTAACEHHVLGAERMRDWRRAVHGGGLHAARRLQARHGGQRVAHLLGVSRRLRHRLPRVRFARRCGGLRSGWVDTLFFPGCSLVSYAPEVTRAVGNWLTESGIAWALIRRLLWKPSHERGSVRSRIGVARGPDREDARGGHQAHDNHLPRLRRGVRRRHARGHRDRSFAGDLASLCGRAHAEEGKAASPRCRRPRSPSSIRATIVSTIAMRTRSES